jgi:hypothetical protein
VGTNPSSKFPKHASTVHRFRFRCSNGQNNKIIKIDRISILAYARYTIEDGGSNNNIVSDVSVVLRIKCIKSIVPDLVVREVENTNNSNIYLFKKIFL